MRLKMAPWRDTETGEVDGEDLQLFLWAFGIPFGIASLGAGLLVGTALSMWLGAAAFFATCALTAAAPSIVERFKPPRDCDAGLEQGESVRVVEGTAPRYGQVGSVIFHDSWEQCVWVKFPDGAAVRLLPDDVTRAAR